MNASDEKMLQDFLGQLVQARGVTKDPDAEALIRRAAAQQPDATYLLVQRALLVEQALGNAKARIAELEGQSEKGNGFLDANSWGNSAQASPSNPVPGMGQGGYGQNGPTGSATAAAPAKSGGLLGGAGGSMLGTVAATAAGVAAGSFLFHGIGNLLGNDGQGAANHLLADNTTENGALADQAGIGAVDETDDAAADSVADNNNEDSLGGFFDGDGSDEGLFG